MVVYNLLINIVLKFDEYQGINEKLIDKCRKDCSNDARKKLGLKNLDAAGPTLKENQGQVVKKVLQRTRTSTLLVTS